MCLVAYPVKEDLTLATVPNVAFLTSEKSAKC
jgi:hypothetical protein